MESFKKNNENKNTNKNSFVNTLKSVNPFSKTNKSIDKFKSETNIDSINQSLNKTISKKESNKPLTSIMEKMSSIKPSETMKQSLGKVSNLTSESIKNVSQTISNESSMSFLKILLYIIIGILLLSFIGFNIFKYLGEGTDFITNLSAPFVDIFATITGNTAKTTISNTSTGSKTIVDNLEKGTVGTVDFVQKKIKDKANTISNKQIVSTENDDSLADNKKLNNNEPEPTRTNTLNSGYCYIGKINDTRYCAKVSGRDQCMSGDIYPSMDICVNPNLRT